MTLLRHDRARHEIVPPAPPHPGKVLCEGFMLWCQGVAHSDLTRTCYLYVAPGKQAVLLARR